jgi:hypothetical protein
MRYVARIGEGNVTELGSPIIGLLTDLLSKVEEDRRCAERFQQRMSPDEGYAMAVNRAMANTTRMEMAMGIKEDMAVPKFDFWSGK